MTIVVRVQTNDFDIAAEYHALRKYPAHGAVSTFTGLVRELEGRQLHAMTLEYYPGMTERTLREIAREACNRWQLGAVTLIHRVGYLTMNEQIVFIGVASAHRAAAFAGTEFIIDHLKTRAPFWKKEHTFDETYWVNSKESDDVAIARWDQKIQ